MNKKTDSQRRNDAHITAEESKLATEMQAPVIRSVDEGQHETKAIARVSTFKELKKFARSPHSFGGNVAWIQPERLFNEQYEGGLISIAFMVTKAFSFTSKKFNVPRLGLEIVLDSGQMFLVALGLNEKDIKRNEMVTLFTDDKGKAIPGAQPIGPFVLTKLPTLKGHDYYDIAPAETRSNSEEISFVVNDPDVAF